MKYIFLGLISVSLFAMTAAAQDEVSAPHEGVAINIQTMDIAPVEPYPEGFRSLFFTKTEHDAVVAALARHGGAMPVAPMPAAPTAPLPAPDAKTAAAAPRVLHLSGIVSAAPGDWSIWLNGRQVTPSRLPPEVREIHVDKEYVALKWYDAQTQAVVPVKMRTHQRFNIDSRTFMPGALADMPPPVSAETP